MQVLNACSSLQDLFLNMSSLINSSTLAHALRIPTSLQGSDCTLSCCISQYGCNTFCPCPNFTCPNIMALQETTVCLGMHPVEHSLSIIHAPTFSMHINKRYWPQKYSHNYLQWTVCAHTCLHPMPLYWHMHKGHRLWLHSLKLHLLKEFQCLLPFPTFYTSQNHCSPWDNIVYSHPAEYSLCLFDAFGIHVHKGTGHKDIRFKIALTDLFINTPPLINCHYTGTCIQTANKSAKAPPLPVTFVETAEMRSALAHISYVLESCTICHTKPARYVKMGQLHILCRPWCHSSHLCLHPWGGSSCHQARVLPISDSYWGGLHHAQIETVTHLQVLSIDQQ